MPVFEIMSRVLQNIAAMLAAYIIIEIETKEGGEFREKELCSGVRRLARQFIIAGPRSQHKHTSY